MARFNYRHFVSSALLVKSALSVSGDSAAGTIDGHVVGVVEDGGAVSPHLSRNLVLDLFDRVGDSGRCTDYAGNPYNTITAAGTSVSACATACAAKPRSYQVGFEFLSTSSSCSCLYSAGNVPVGDGVITDVTDATGKYAVLSSTTGVTGLSCYKVKVRPVFYFMTSTLLYSRLISLSLCLPTDLPLLDRTLSPSLSIHLLNTPPDPL